MLKSIFINLMKPYVNCITLNVENTPCIITPWIENKLKRG